ncbi:MAG: response regulator [Rhodoferax sp.]|uniref:response regulator n=1 Tax=Candidatus Aalborgicola defluviihabitans TaxID=3386187 RepID=UPI00390B12DB|nr:response regulator [Burkholderiales bacterium]
MTQLARILLVEDNPNDLELTLEALSEYHLTNEVVVARDGQEAMDYLLRQGQFADRPLGNPAVVLLDLKLPKIDGMEVLRLIKTDAQLKVVPVVIMTASREERDLAQGYMLGANAYVVKPVDFHELIDAVKALGIFWAVVNQSPPGSASRSV